MYVACWFMRFRKILLGGCVRAWVLKIEIFRIAYMKIEANPFFSALPGDQRLERRFAPEVVMIYDS